MFARRRRSADTVMSCACFLTVITHTEYCLPGMRAGILLLACRGKQFQNNMTGTLLILKTILRPNGRLCRWIFRKTSLPRWNGPPDYWIPAVWVKASVSGETSSGTDWPFSTPNLISITFNGYGYVRSSRRVQMNCQGQVLVACWSWRVDLTLTHSVVYIINTTTRYAHRREMSRAGETVDEKQAYFSTTYVRVMSEAAPS